MNIPKNARVLEIGSGNHPYYRSDILCDKYLDDSSQRGSELIIDRPLIIADGQYLPFANHSFDYAICRHVVEHVEDPKLLFHELTRVARAGYFEIPSEISEKVYGWGFHHWVFKITL